MTRTLLGTINHNDRAGQRVALYALPDSLNVWVEGDDGDLHDTDTPVERLSTAWGGDEWDLRLAGDMPLAEHVGVLLRAIHRGELVLWPEHTSGGAARPSMGEPTDPTETVAVPIPAEAECVEALSTVEGDSPIIDAAMAICDTACRAWQRQAEKAWTGRRSAIDDVSVALHSAATGDVPEWLID
jgi:hypothetical protein